MRKLNALSLLLLLPAAGLHAQEFAPAPPPPPLAPQESAPPPPAQVPKESAQPSVPKEETGEPEPEVTIIKRKEETIEEYRVNGQLYMVKVTPAKGYPYYLIDTNGDGILDTRRNELDNPPIFQWKILRW